MQIVFILKGSIDALPPMLPRLKIWSGLCENIVVICDGISESTAKLLKGWGIRYFSSDHSSIVFSRRSKIKDWLLFRRGVQMLLRRNIEHGAILYVCSADTAMCLGTMIRRYKYVFQSNELYDDLPIYKHCVGVFAKRASAFIVPDYCRANICATWYGLANLPFVIPNQTLVDNIGERNQHVDDEVANKIISEISNKKIILYQGHIYAERRLNNLAMALKKMGNADYVLVLMGKIHDNSSDHLKNIYPYTYHIPYVTPPGHLQITSHAYIGVLNYERTSLNNVFCAPNKLYEYGVFRIPMLANDIPGHRFTIGVNHTGICVDFNNIDEIIEGIRVLDKNYDQYAQNSHEMSRSCDIEETIKRIYHGLQD